MTPEKKKRITKPAPSEATRFLLENCMDFLNLPFEKFSCQLAVGEDIPGVADLVLPAVANPLSVFMKWHLQLHDLLRILKDCGWEEQKTLQSLLCTLSGTRTMIGIALGQHGNSVSFPANYREMPEPWDHPVSNCDIHTWIHDALRCLAFSPSWHSKGSTQLDLLPYDPRTFFQPGSNPPLSEKDRINTWIRGFRGFMVKTIGDSFGANNGEISNGAFYIGQCRCGKIFKKPSIDTLYCSGACKKASYRDKLKS